MAGDANFDKVSLLLHMDGTNGSTTFTDTSPSPKTVTASGGAAISTAQSKFGGASLSLSGGYLSVADSPSFDVATGDFAIEMWLRPASLSANGILCNKQSGTASGYPFQAFVNTAGGVVFRSYNEAVQELFTVTTASGLLAVGVWAHLALVRFGSVFGVYVNGSTAGTANFSGTLPANSLPVVIGAYSNGVAPFIGHIDDLRITKGLARYTANFTPPTEPFPNTGVAYALSGTVTGDTGAPAARLIRAYREDTGALAGSATSDEGSGVYSIVVDTSGAHTLNAYPAAGESLPTLTLRGVLPA